MIFIESRLRIFIAICTVILVSLVTIVSVKATAIDKKEIEIVADGPIARSIPNRKTQKREEETIEIQVETPVKENLSYEPEYGLDLDAESYIYEYLITNLDLNEAQALGILTNIYCESRYKPDASPSDRVLGLVQWTATRYDDYIYYCNANVLWPTNMDVQLDYLKMELTEKYTTVYDKIKECPNTTEGLRDAAYIFCKYYEIPYQTEKQSVYRGDLAVTMFGNNI